MSVMWRSGCRHIRSARSLRKAMREGRVRLKERTMMDGRLYRSIECKKCGRILASGY